MKQIQVTLSEPLLENLDKITKEKDISRSELIRRLLDRSLRKGDLSG